MCRNFLRTTYNSRCLCTKFSHRELDTSGQTHLRLPPLKKYSSLWSKNLVPESPNIINIGTALLIRFTFTRISCPTTKSSQCNKFLTPLILLSQNLKTISLPSICFTHTIIKLCSHLLKITLQGHFQMPVSQNATCTNNPIQLSSNLNWQMSCSKKFYIDERYPLDATIYLLL